MRENEMQNTQSLMRYSIKIVLLLWLSTLMHLVKADIVLDVVGVGGQQFPIAITPLKGEDSSGQALSSIISADLIGSGLFKLIDISDLPRASTPQEIPLKLIKAKGAQTQLVGSINPDANGYTVRFWLVDVIQGKVLFGYDKVASNQNMRQVAHEIADLIYRQLTGEPGIFSTKIAFVMRGGRGYQLQVADADGFGAHTILSSPEPIISPRWSPDGTKIAYVSFERKKPEIFVQNVITGARYALATFKGSNSAPAWSFDSKQLAIVLTRDGYSQIYLINANGGGLRRLTVSNAIDTEPSFSPDGQSIIFTSDRGGSPQIYQMPVSGGPATRLTYDGNYNASAKFSPDGKSIVLIHRGNGGYQVAIMDLASRQMIALTAGAKDDSPSFAPNGRVILYKSIDDGRSVLASVSKDGLVKQKFRSGRNIHQPTWGPFL